MSVLVGPTQVELDLPQAFPDLLRVRHGVRPPHLVQLPRGQFAQRRRRNLPLLFGAVFGQLQAQSEDSLQVADGGQDV